MPQYLNTVTVASPRNGTTTHTVSASAGTTVGGTPFTPTLGRLLVCIASAPGTLTTPTGWTRPFSTSTGGIGGYVFTRYATGTVADNITTTASISDAPAAFAFFEFPVEFAILPQSDGGIAISTVASGVSGGSVVNPSPTEVTPAFGCAFQLSDDDTGAFSTFSWTTGTEVVDTGVGRNGVGGGDGYALGVTYLDNMTGASISFVPTLTRTTPASNRIYFAVYRRLVRQFSTGASSPTGAVDAMGIGGFGTLVAGDLVVSTVAIKPATATVTLPAAAVTAGWELVTEATNGADPSGLDTGSMKLQVYAKRYPINTNYTLLQSGADSICVSQVSLRPAVGYTAWDVTAVTTGGDTTDGTAFAATGAADIALAVDDVMSVVEAVNSDTASVSSTPTASVPGVAFSKLNIGSVRTATSTVGNQSRVSGFEFAVVGGPSAGPPSVAHNLSTAASGAVAFLRLRVGLSTVYSASATGSSVSTGSADATVPLPPLPVSASGLGRTAGYASATVVLGPMVSNPSSIVAAGTWLTTTSVYTSDNTYATNVGTTQNTEYPMDVGGFNFAALPANATISSTTVSIEAKTGTAARAQIKGEMYDGATLISGGQLVLTNLTAADAFYTFATNPTVAQLKSANLLVRVTNKRTASQASTTSVDHVKITVSYTVPATGSTLLAGAIGDSWTTGSAAADIITAPTGPTTLSATATGTGLTTGSAAAIATLAASAAGTGQTGGSAAATVLVPAVVHAATATGTGTTTGSAAVTGKLTASATGSGTSTGSAAAVVLVMHVASASGTGVSTGSAAVRVVNAASATGSGLTTGSAAAISTLVATATGSGVSTGSAAAGLIQPASATGSGVTGGSAAAISTLVASATGTGQSSGSAAAGVVRPVSATGTGQTTGSAAAVIAVGAVTWSASATGTGQTGGSVAAGMFLGASATGSGLTTGSAAACVVMAVSAAGTGQSTGSAAVQAVLAASATGTGLSAGSAATGVVRPVSASGSGAFTGSAAAGAIRTASATGSGSTTGSAAIIGTLAASATGSGQSTGSATALIGTTRPVSASGSGTFTGSAAAVLVTGPVIRGASATGSGQTGGSATVQMVAMASASGSGVSTGSATVRMVAIASASGSGVSTGSASMRVIAAVSASGTGQTGGSAAARIILMLSASATGSGQTGGSAAAQLLMVLSASGSDTSAGSATIRLLMVLSATGASVSTGSAQALLVLVGVGRPKVWNGSAWVAVPAKVWNGSTWVEKPVKVWNGSTWKPVS